MSIASNVDQNQRTIVVDVIRGFALIGVLFANFTSFVDQQTPPPILNSISSSLDFQLMMFNSVFVEWKFMTLFSILFGYGFGLILESLERKEIDANSFFARRMFWLFIFGCFHCLFWWADVLHLYAVSGILLIAFKNGSKVNILTCAVLFALIIPPFISYAFRNLPETFTASDIESLFHQYKTGSIVEVFAFNIKFYYRMFIVSGGDLHDIVETLGRFLFGYYLLRINLFNAVETKRYLFLRTAFLTTPFMIAYFIVRWYEYKGAIRLDEFLYDPLMSLGIICTTTFYVNILVLAYISFGRNKFFRALTALGRMTLTNYLMVSAFLVVLLYGFGFNKLGVLPIHIIWLYALGLLSVEIIFSVFWLKYFRYGPLEWIWRQLSYGRRLELRK